MVGASAVEKAVVARAVMAEEEAWVKVEAAVKVLATEGACSAKEVELTVVAMAAEAMATEAAARARAVATVAAAMAQEVATVAVEKVAEAMATAAVEKAAEAMAMEAAVMVPAVATAATAMESLKLRCNSCMPRSLGPPANSAQRWPVSL